MLPVDFWAEDPAPVNLGPHPHPGFSAPHPLRCARFGCCQPIAWMTLDLLVPYLGNCAEHRTRWTPIPVTVYQTFSDWPQDMRAYVQQRLSAELTKLKAKRTEAA